MLGATYSCCRLPNPHHSLLCYGAVRNRHVFLNRHSHCGLLSGAGAEPSRACSHTSRPGTEPCVRVENQHAESTAQRTLKLTYQLLRRLACRFRAACRLHRCSSG